MGDETKGGFFEFGTRTQSQILTFFEEIIDGLHRMNDNIDCEHEAQGIVLHILLADGQMVLMMDLIELFRNNARVSYH